MLDGVELVMAINEKAMKTISSLDEVIGFLSDQLRWPVDSSDLERSTFKYTPEELGVDAFVGERINSIRQIRPEKVDQPWGIFLLDLEGTNLTKKTIRDVLKGLTAKRRSDKQPGTWNKENLLFIVSSGRDRDFQIHFLSFKPLEQAKTEIRTLDWNPRKSPPQKIRRLSKELLPLLTWPKKDIGSEAWLNIWGGAFKVPLGKIISDAASLAKRMADVAIKLRETMLDGLEKEQGKGPLSSLLELIQAEIDSDANQKTFADMCAQTITYGLLAARVNDPEGFASSPVFDSFSLSDEFLESLFAEVQDAVSLPPDDAQSIEGLAADLISSNVEAILDEFGNSSDGGDPVIHFYEQFLFLYDREIRMAAGAFYTPKPVVDTMVRMVDELLVSRFGLSKGFADDSTWLQVCNFLNIEVPSDKLPDSRFLSILDPATGTGTYLVSVIERAKANLVRSSMPEAEVLKYMSEKVVPKLTAFELMLGPYSIANLKLGLAHHGENSDFPKTIFLTNTLDLSHSSGELFYEPNALSSEGQAAHKQKMFEPFTVILGNPPYGQDKNKDGATRNVSDRLGGAMRHDSTLFETPPIQNFLSRLPEAGIDKKRGAFVYNLYSYFWRWSIWQVLQKRIDTEDGALQNTKSQNPGIVAFITASSFVATDSFAAMRAYMRSEFDELFVIDLGGSALNGSNDPNIFPIQTPVSICIGVRTSALQKSGTCSVKYARIEGTRDEKLIKLSQLDLGSMVDSEGGEFSSFAGRDKTRLANHLPLQDFFQDCSSACLPGRTWVSSPSKAVLERRWQSLMTAETESAKSALMQAKKARNVHSTPRPFITKDGMNLRPLIALGKDAQPEEIIRYSFRSFDNQWLIGDMRLIGQPSAFREIRHENQFWLGSGRSITNGPSVIAFKFLPDFDAFDGRGGKDFFPAYKDPFSKTLNLSQRAKSFLQELEPGLSEMSFIHYVYAIHGSSAYSSFFEADLRLGDSRAALPLTSDLQVFKSLCQIGEELLSLHLRDSLNGYTSNQIKFTTASVSQVETPPNQFSYNEKTGDVYFDDMKYCSVPKEIWDFKVGRLKVVQGFLKNRTLRPKGLKGSPLTEINETKWIYSDEFVKLIADVSAVLEAKKLVLPLLQKVVDEVGTTEAN